MQQNSATLIYDNSGDLPLKNSTAIQNSTFRSLKNRT